ncbi:MAG: acyl-CoA thioesterase [Phycisphaerae bacterium]
MSQTPFTTHLRVRYSETDQMGTFYNSRALEWFEVGRTEALRFMGLPYAEMETRGIFLPLVEANVRFLGPARYDDLLEMTVRLAPEGKARLRFDVEIVHDRPAREPVVRGSTVHAVTNHDGRPVRPPQWLRKLLSQQPE